MGGATRLPDFSQVHLHHVSGHGWLAIGPCRGKRGARAAHTLGYTVEYPEFGWLLMSALGARVTLRMPFPRVLRCIECAKPRLATNDPRFVVRLEHARLIQAPKRDFDLIAIVRDDT